MSTKPKPYQILPQVVISHNRRLERTLWRRLNMTLAVYKTVESLTELAAVFLGFYAIAQGADPMITFLGVAVIVGGWKVIEFLAVYADEISTATEAMSEVSGDDDE